jgi:hypothetical protein
MPDMNDYLAQFYGTAKVAAAPVVSDDELQKQASVDMFLKVAAAENIDLHSLPDEQVQYLYGEFVKAASEEPPEEKKEKEKKEEEEKKHAAAAAEHATKLATTEKLAEADYLGRVIAHSFVQELGNISKEAASKEAAGMPEALRKGIEAAKGHAGKAIGAAKEHGAAAKEHADKAFEAAKGHMGKAVAEVKKHPGASHAAAGAAGAAAGAAAMHYGKKHGSAFEQVAGETAVGFAGSQGWDTEEAGRKVAAVLELGLLGESEKVASEADYQTSIGIRALEILEVAGYPVTWTT